jgi:hypothetical protein
MERKRSGTTKEKKKFKKKWKKGIPIGSHYRNP